MEMFGIKKLCALGLVLALSACVVHIECACAT
jgi:hypothetical protein